MKIERTRGAIQFSWKRKPAEGWSIIVMVTILLVLITIAALTPAPYSSARSQNYSLSMAVFFFCLFSPMLYIGAALVSNTTTLSSDHLTVRRSTGPLWVNKVSTFSTDGARQFFATAAGSGRNSTGYLSGTVYFINAEDEVHLIVSGLPSSFAANQIAHELNDFYGIEDMPVYGVTTDPAHPGPRGLTS